MDAVPRPIPTRRRKNEGQRGMLISSLFARKSCTENLVTEWVLKNLFTVHFQFDLLKLETDNTRDDKMNHAWIIAR